MNKATLLTLILLLTCVICFGQSTYRGLTPGKSTRAEVERVLGRPAKNISQTLVEYKGDAEVNKVYVQYESDANNAATLRIEVICEEGQVVKEERLGCRGLYESLVPNHHKIRGGAPFDARIMPEPNDAWIIDDTMWHPSPYYVVSGMRQRRDISFFEWRIGLYAKELYDAAVPKSCTGTFVGVWDSSRGPMTITRKPSERKPDSPYLEFIGTYSPNGKVSGTESNSDVEGEWKDATGSGTFHLTFNDVVNAVARGRSFEGEWERTTGKGPKKGKWTGRCVEPN